ncbi:MAG TPA: ABC transporter permease [Chitinophagaceae bacterium]|nr:ABC transporter permease [Chitinophagaceae bacterium]
MFANYLKIAWRNLTRNKLYSSINIGGLAVGITVAILIGLWIYDEVSFNKNHQNYNRIAQVVQHQHIGEGMETYEALPLPVAELLRSRYGSDFRQVAATVTLEQFVTNGDKVFTRVGTFAEPKFPAIFSLEMVSGSGNSISDPSSILLSESLSRILFGQENPLNKPVKINNAFTQKVTGVYRDLPKNSHFSEINFVAPLTLLVQTGSNDDWQSSSFRVYTQLSEKSSFEKVSTKIKNILYENSKDATKPLLSLNPMSRWHLYEFKNGEQVAGRAQFVWLFAIIDVLVLILASINFMNLSTARSAKRAKEIGIRKTLGSKRAQLIYQLFCECLLIVLLSTALAILLVAFTMESFSRLADKELNIPFRDANFWLIGTAFILFTVLISGSYPALYLSSFKPIKVLKGVFQAGPLAAVPRKSLVVIQFTVSVTLIIGTLIVYRQIQFAKNRPVGYDRARLLTIPMNSPQVFDNYQAFKNALLSANHVENVSRSSSTTTDIASSANNLDWKGKNPNEQVMFGTILVDPEYGNLVNWKLAAGRNFSNQIRTDSSAFIFNESAIRVMGLKNPIGEIVKWHDKSWRIIGIAKDMVMKSPFEKSTPTVFLMDDKERNFNVIHIKLSKTKAVDASLKNIAATFKKFCPSVPFDYKFTDDTYAGKFKNEERIGTLAAVFATLAIFISCLGLFGLASYIAEQRTREIGVRKVLGASVFNLWKMLSKDFMVLVLTSCLVAIPVAWYFLNQWLQKYEYRTTVSWWVFAGAGAGALLITLLTVSYHVIKAALANPVKSLRSE